ncbi:hypothetical protein WJ0W_007121 [Paenibacillus melissococcoides]|uniref:Uncharacterized protein n=1 Tax=Paenibacillus melissococcoides TaxID=2912268 RepID=A0ABM9G9J4_9BACL|nr:hypothetical protein [Paenibacillus melissococcoides]CAH8248453.1 hypothetical protein WJ0W_007121 [Paenibacillus melissococcoides]CAH8722053.1 hypothetical protein HTL2_006669 [Paenibacillus melissococcoides]CAH8722155.1 hypothetical protein WDD9_006658 [Paenibacillus melissococcoides]
MIGKFFRRSGTNQALSKNDEKPRVGLLSNHDALNQWLIENLEDSEVIVLNTNNYREELPVQVLLCFDFDDPHYAEKMVPIAQNALERRTHVIWAVDGPAEWRNRVETDLARLGAFIAPYEEEIDAALILGYIQNGLQIASVSLEEPTHFDTPEPTYITETNKVVAEENHDCNHQEPKLKAIQNSLSSTVTIPRLIAVCGFASSGVSTISFGISSFLQKPVTLIEGGNTEGSLARWHSRATWADTHGETQTLQGYLEQKGGCSLPQYPYIDFALGGSGNITLADVQSLQNCALQNWIVVDCGTDFSHPLFQAAGLKVFVTTPDPQHLFVPRPALSEIDVFILNRYPEQLPISTEEIGRIYNRDFDLIVRDQPRNIYFSLWAKESWIKHLTYAEAQRWADLFGIG